MSRFGSLPVVLQQAYSSGTAGAVRAFVTCAQGLSLPFVRTAGGHRPEACRDRGGPRCVRAQVHGCGRCADLWAVCRRRSPPARPDHGHALAAAQQDGLGAMLCFELEGGVDAVRRFVEAIRVFALAESLGGVESPLNPQGS